MPNTPPFPVETIEALARVVGDCVTGSDINRALQREGLDDGSGESTKWKRLSWMFDSLQRHDRSANSTLKLVRTLVSRERFVDAPGRFEDCRASVNVVLALRGIQYGADGEFRPVEAAKTLPEAEQRAQTVESKIRGYGNRRLHPDVLRYCRAEVMEQNYFHAAFEATKGLAEKIREKSGATDDGAALVDKVFLAKEPLLALNQLETETELSQQRGLAFLLKGCFAAVRNPRAHEPRILWNDEEDLADYFTLISLLHYKLDRCVPTDPQAHH